MFAVEAGSKGVTRVIDRNDPSSLKNSFFLTL